MKWLLEHFINVAYCGESYEVILENLEEAGAPPEVL